MKYIKKISCIAVSVALLTLSPISKAQSLVTQAAEVAKALTQKSAANINAQVGVVTGGEVTNDAKTYGGGNAAAGVNAQAGKLGNGQNSVVGVNAQVGVVSSGKVTNNARAYGGGNAAAGVNAQAVGQ